MQKNANDRIAERWMFRTFFGLITLVVVMLVGPQSAFEDLQALFEVERQENAEIVSLPNEVTSKEALAGLLAERAITETEEYCSTVSTGDFVSCKTAVLKEMSEIILQEVGLETSFLDETNENSKPAARAVETDSTHDVLTAVPSGASAFIAPQGWAEPVVSLIIGKSSEDVVENILQKLSTEAEGLAFTIKRGHDDELPRISGPPDKTNLLIVFSSAYQVTTIRAGESFEPTDMGSVLQYHSYNPSLRKALNREFKNISKGCFVSRIKDGSGMIDAAVVLINAKLQNYNQSSCMRIALNVLF